MSKRWNYTLKSLALAVFSMWQAFAYFETFWIFFSLGCFFFFVSGGVWAEGKAAPPQGGPDDRA